VRAGKTFRRPTLRPAKNPGLDDVGIIGALIGALRSKNKTGTNSS
jgi:hypothetical protein